MSSILLMISALFGAAPTTPMTEVSRLLDTQIAAWNRGDLEAFCAVYAEDASFLSPSGLKRGRAEVLARYRERYPDRAAMGSLSLTLIEGRDTADMVALTARWKLAYPNKAAAEGLTLIVFQRQAGGWRIVQDASM